MFSKTEKSKIRIENTENIAVGFFLIAGIIGILILGKKKLGDFYG